MSGATWIRIGAILGGIAVTAGAFGAHGLKERIDARSLEVFETAAKYQMYHALALIAVGLLAMAGRTGAALSVAGWSFLLGTLIFSGTLYGLSISGIKWLGAITPIGGLAFIVGWIALAIAAGGPSKVGPEL
ncbi:DUF423 domain-containing protein [Tundrisphaera lichenicola]|uniref:DUF423 domain-containing protein n=1 Tax=Tundrisphaera lichenicola TaxID=2029860 RepID=UPI003EB91CEC